MVLNNKTTPTWCILIEPLKNSKLIIINIVTNELEFDQYKISSYLNIR